MAGRLKERHSGTQREQQAASRELLFPHSETGSYGACWFVCMNAIWPNDSASQGGMRNKGEQSRSPRVAGLKPESGIGVANLGSEWAPCPPHCRVA